MTDEQLAKYLCIENAPNRDLVIAKIGPTERATYERMAQVEMELSLWQAGLGPKPTGVLIDFGRKAFR